MQNVLKTSAPAQILASAEVERGEYTGRVRMRGPRGGKKRGRMPGELRPQRPKTPSVGAARAARARGEEQPAPRVTDRVPCRGTPVTICLSLGLEDADALDRQAEAAGMTRSSYMRHLIWSAAK